MKYLTTDPTVNECDARIEDGCYAEPELDTHAVWTWEPQTPFEKHAEEARWAARSGPCVVVRPATVTALPAATNRQAGRLGTGVAA